MLYIRDTAVVFEVPMWQLYY